MRRLPIFFLIDVSESMVGTPIQQVEQGMRSIIQDLQSDPYALETAFVEIIAFAGKARVLTPLTEMYKFYPPVFPIGGGTSLGAALSTLMDEIDTSVQKTTKDRRGDWKPIIFLFTDGTPTDNYKKTFDRWNDKYRRHCNLIAISIGDNINTGILGQITENVLQLKTTTPESFSKFFKWISASISTSSVSVSEQNSDELKLPSTRGIELEKVDPHQEFKVDENFVLLRARCQNTKQDYLIKFARRSEDFGISQLEGFKSVSFRLVGAYPIDNKTYSELSATTAKNNPSINSNELVGMPVCPCCGNQMGAVMCECGGLFCADPEKETLECPWCGMTGSLGNVGEGGMDINRTLG